MSRDLSNAVSAGQVRDVEMPLTDAVAALRLNLTAEEIAVLESAYVPHTTAGHK